MIDKGNESNRCNITIDYLNHDPAKPIIIIQATSHCFVRIIPSLDIEEIADPLRAQKRDTFGPMIPNSDDSKNGENAEKETNDFLNSDDDNDSDSDSEDELDEELDADIVTQRIFFGPFYKKFKILSEQYGLDLNKWTYTKLARSLYPGHLKKAKDFEQQIFKQFVSAQQILEDMFLKQSFLEFYAACHPKGGNPNLHRALVLIKAWWAHCNFHSSDNGPGSNPQGRSSSDSTRFGAINSFHLTQYLMMMHRTYHIDKWDSPLLIMAKFLEMVSRETLGTMLCQPPPCSLFEAHPKWYTSFADSHLYRSLTMQIENNRDRASIFNPKEIDHSKEQSKANANIHDDENDDGDIMDVVHYSYSIWKTKQHGLVMAAPSDAENALFDSWVDEEANQQQKLYLKMLSSQFGVVFSDLSGRQNFTFRVTRTNYLHFIKEARKASTELNELLLQIPFMPNPDYWSYKTPIDPAKYDIVRGWIMAFFRQSLQNLLIPNTSKFWMYFDGFIRLNITDLIQRNVKHKLSALFMVKEVESILMTTLSDRCRTFVIQYEPTLIWNEDTESKTFWNDQLVIGLSMHTFAFRDIILGPPHWAKEEGKEFKQFWGPDQVHTQRFPDGQILNTVLLTDEEDFPEYVQAINADARNAHINKISMELQEIKNSIYSKEKQEQKKKNMEIKRSPSIVIKVMLYHALKRHLGIKMEHIELTLDPLWSVTPKCLAHSRHIGQKDAYFDVNVAYRKLEAMLNRICNDRNNSIPLRVKELTEIDANLWNLSVVPPPKKRMEWTSYSLIDSLEPMIVILHFEHSNCWPQENAKALEALKSAFYIQIHRAFQKYDVATSLLSRKYLDVVVYGFAFRCFIKSSTENKCRHKLYAGKKQRLKRRELRFMPKYGRAIQGVADKYAYFGPTVSVVKRWLSCNLFSDLIDELLIMVLVADIFVNPEPYGTPQSVFMAFLRFLHLMARFNWVENPYVVDLGLYKPENAATAQAKSSATLADQFKVFKEKMWESRQNRQQLHSMFVVVPGLEDESSWTRKKPTLPTLDRLVTTARTSYHFFMTLISEHVPLTISAEMKTIRDRQCDDDEFLRVFKPSKDEFDFIIRLKTEMVPKYKRNVWRTVKGMNDWRAQQILKRMGKITTEQQDKSQERLQKKLAAAKEEQEKKEEKESGKISVDEKLMPFVPNPVWEKKKRKFEEHENEPRPRKKQKVWGGKEFNPEKFLEEKKLLVVGVDPVELYVRDVRYRAKKHVETYYDANGGDYIGCKWRNPAEEGTQRTVFAALWAMGNGLVKSIKVLKCPLNGEIGATQALQTDTVRKLKAMISMMSSSGPPSSEYRRMQQRTQGQALTGLERPKRQIDDHDDGGPWMLVKNRRKKLLIDMHLEEQEKEA